MYIVQCCDHVLNKIQQKKFMIGGYKSFDDVIFNQAHDLCVTAQNTIFGKPSL